MRRLWRFRTLVFAAWVAGTVAAGWYLGCAAAIAVGAVGFLLWVWSVSPRAAGVLVLLLVAAGGLFYVHRDRFLRAWIEAEVRTALEAALGVAPTFDRVVATERRFVLQGLRARGITRLGPVRALAAGEVAIDVDLWGLAQALVGVPRARVVERFTLVRPYLAIEAAPDGPPAAPPAPPRAPTGEWPPLPFITVQDGTVAVHLAGATGDRATALIRRIDGELRPLASGATQGRLQAQAHCRWERDGGLPPVDVPLADCRGRVQVAQDTITVDYLQERRLEAPLQGGLTLALPAPGRPGWSLASDLAWDDGRARLDGTFAAPGDGAPARLTASLRGFALTPLLELLGIRDVGAALAPEGTSVEAEFPKAGAAGRVEVALRDVRWRDGRLAEVRAVATRGDRGPDGRVAAAPDAPWNLTIDARGPDGEDTAFEAMGPVGVDGALDLTVLEARLHDLALLGLWPDDAGRPRIAGRAELLNGKLTGTVAAPVLSGRLTVRDGRVGDVAGLDLDARLLGLGRDEFTAADVGVLRESSRRAPETQAPLVDALREGWLKIRWNPRAAKPGDRFALSCAFAAKLAALEDYAPLPKWLGLSLRTTSGSQVRMQVQDGQFQLNLSGVASDEVRVGGERVGHGSIGALHWQDREASGASLRLDWDDDRASIDLDARLRAMEGAEHRWELDVSRAVLGKPGQELTLVDRARAVVDDAGLDLDPARLDGPGGSVRWRGTIRVDRLDLHGRIIQLDVATVAGLLGLPHVRGTIVSGQVQIGGTPKEPLGSVSCVARGVAYGHVDGADLELHARLRDGRLLVHDSSLAHAAGARVEVRTADLPAPADGTRGGLDVLLAALADPALALDIEARKVPVAWVQPYRDGVPPVPGLLEMLTLELRPAAAGAVGEARFAWRDAHVQGFPCAGTGGLTLTPDRLTLAGDGARLTCLGGHARLTGHVPRPAGTDASAWLARDGLALAVELAGVELRALLPLRDGEATPPLLTDGRAGARMTLAGSLGRARLEGELEMADLAVGDVRQIAGRVAVRTEHRPGPGGLQELLRFTEGRLTGLGLVASFTGGIPLAVGLEVARGPAGDRVLRARDPASALGSSDLQVRLAEGDLRGLLAAWEAQRRVPAARRVSPDVSGAIAGEWTMAGSWQHPSGQGRLTVSDFAFRGVENGSAEAVLLWIGNSLELRELSLRTASGELHGELRADWDPGASPGSGRLDGSFETRRIDVGVLETWLPEVLRRAEGTLSTPEPVRVSGTTGAPLLHGRLRIDDVSLASTSPDLPRIERLRGEVRLDGDVVVIDAPPGGIRGRVGGGEAVLWGRAAIGADATELLDLRLAASGALLFAGREGLRMRATLEGRDAPDDGLRVRFWRVDVPGARPGSPRPMHAAITGTVRLTSTQWSKDHDASPSQGDRPLDLGFEIPGVERTTVDVALRTDRPVRIRNNVAWLDLDVVGALTLTGPSTAPLVEGRVQARADGKFRLPIPFGGQIITPREFEVRDLTVEFGTARPGQPKLKCTLVLQYRDWEITARVDGQYYPIQNFNDIALASTPSLTNEEIAAILVLGAPLPDSAAMRAAAISLASKVGLDILNQILFRGEGGLGSELLTRLSIEASAGDALGDSAIRAEFRVQPWLNLYGAREADGTYSGGVGLRYALPRDR